MIFVVDSSKNQYKTQTRVAKKLMIDYIEKLKKKLMNAHNVRGLIALKKDRLQKIEKTFSCEVVNPNLNTRIII